MPKIRQILIVDGYNVINAWDILKTLANESLELAREKLNSLISEYTQYTGYKTILVYDAYRVKDFSVRQERLKNLEIVFTKENEIADSYIEKYITSLSKKRYLEIFIATDDISIMQIGQGKGAVHISTAELLINVNTANLKIRDKIKKNHVGNNSLNNFIDKDTYKLLDELRKGDVKEETKEEQIDETQLFLQSMKKLKVKTIKNKNIDKRNSK